MATLAVLALFGFVVLPAIGWALRLTFKIVGWSLRMALGVIFMPLWIVILLVGGFAVAAHALIPIAIVWFVLGLVFAEN